MTHLTRIQHPVFENISFPWASISGYHRTEIDILVGLAHSETLRETPEETPGETPASDGPRTRIYVASSFREVSVTELAGWNKTIRQGVGQLVFEKTQLTNQVTTRGAAVLESLPFEWEGTHFLEEPPKAPSD